MKFTKMLLLAFSLMLFSCSQDENLNDAQESSYRLKDKGLSDEKFDQLKAECEEMSQSSYFLSMRQKAKDFGDMLNNDYNAEWKTRSELETWLGDNLGKTQYGSVYDALSDFDALDSEVAKFYDENNSFFTELVGGTTEQIQIITEPINGIPDVPVASGFCYVGCLGQFSSRMADIQDMYQRDVEYHNYVVTNGNYNHVSSAEGFRSMRITGALLDLTFCFGECGG